MKYYKIILAFAAILFVTGCAEESKPSSSAIAEEPFFIAEGIRGLSIRKEQQEVLQLTYEPKEHESSYQFWKMPLPYGTEAIVDTEAMLGLYHQLERLDFVPVKEPKTEAETGITDARFSLTMAYCQASEEERKAVLSGAETEKKDGPSYQAEADRRCTLHIGNMSPDGFYYAALASNPEKLYRLQGEVVNEIIRTDPFGLILKVSAIVDLNTVERITAKMDQHEYQLGKTGERYYFGTQAVAEDVFQALYSELLSILVIDELKAEPEERAEVLLELSFKRSRKALEDVHVSYREYNESRALVAVNGVEKLLVERASVERLKERIRSTIK